MQLRLGTCARGGCAIERFFFETNAGKNASSTCPSRVHSSKPKGGSAPQLKARAAMGEASARHATVLQGYLAHKNPPPRRTLQ